MTILKNQRVDYTYRGHQILKGVAVFPDGKEFDWTTCDFMNSVAVLPINRVTNKLILIKQYRPAIQGWCIELVAGGIEDGISVFDNAKKEMIEEIGYSVADENLVSLGGFFVTPGLMNFKTHFFVAFCHPDNYVGQQLEETEMIESIEMSEDELYVLVKQGQYNIDPEIFVALNLYHNILKGAVPE